ncbi:hypothetical protein HMPREF9163_01336 [Selenomonas sp. oral taxon 138 str. F0429]|nr:hypothetical protein HMPREF9163_01336 [Selenomonas sp. oral taxon 138 str. F0429]
MIYLRSRFISSIIILLRRKIQYFHNRLWHYGKQKDSQVLPFVI